MDGGTPNARVIDVMSAPITADERVIATLRLDRRGRRRRVGLRAGLLVAAVLAATVVALLLRRAGGGDREWVTRPAERADLAVTVTATGYLEPIDAVDVGSEISGRVARVLVDFNDRVAEGQPLAELDTELLRAEGRQADAQVSLSIAAERQAQVTLDEARRTFTRAQRLVERGALPDAELDAARHALARAEAGLASAQAQLRAKRAAAELARTSIEKATIRSPFDGVVLVRRIEPGQTVAAAFQTPVLFRIARDLERMKLVVYVDEADIGRVRVGQKATFTVSAHPSRTFEANVTSVHSAPTMRENVVTYDAVLEVDNLDGLLLPGMTATALIDAERYRNALLVPNAGLRWKSDGEPARGGRGRIHVLREGKPVAVDVEIGPTDGTRTIVRSGEVGPGAQVIVEERER
jgi:HlyD family secretion protein